MNKYQHETERAGVSIDPGQPHTGQVHHRKTRFTYDKGAMYYLGEQIVKAMEDSGYPAFIWCCYRPPEKQSEYLAKGTSKAGPWQSPHQFSEAVDILHPTLYWQAPPDYWEQLAVCTRIVAERFNVDLEHGHYWSFVDSAHIELQEWRDFREVVRERWRDDVSEWQAQPLGDDPPGQMPEPNPPTQEELNERFAMVLPKVWRQHLRKNNPSPPPEFDTRRVRRERRRERIRDFLSRRRRK